MLSFVFGILIGALVMGILLEVIHKRLTQNMEDQIYFLEREIKRLKSLVNESKRLTETQKGRINH